MTSAIKKDDDQYYAVCQEINGHQCHEYPKSKVRRSDDCGLFALAFAVTLCNSKDPTEMFLMNIL
jgi:hypothetical protein